MGIFAVTLALFPSIAVTIKSERAGTNYGDRLFIPIYCFLMFNVADLCGRTLAGMVKFPSESKPWLMKWLVSGRFVAIPSLPKVKDVLTSCRQL